ncbi:MAG TPA: glycoside hydrolase family 27 protein [Acidobacteriaceae bacterium]|nr:glycoside hydrolase family 27 protein [Acidobacteriaceae bacterium]
MRHKALVLRSIFISLLALPFFALHAQSPSLASTPPMGWNSWNHFAGKVSDADVRAAADAIVSSGMRDAGYIYVNIDDTWEGQRDAQGNIQSNSKFPDMKALADYVHSKGLKLGIYSSPGPKTCAGYAGSYGHEQQDADTYAKWGIDYLKYDLCSYGKMMKQQAPHDPQGQWQMMQQAYDKMHRALLQTHRPIVYSLCQYGWDAVWKWGPQVGANLWRTTGDISDNYDRMSLIGFSQAGLARYAAPGHWNDPDMLEVGNGKMTPDEYRTHMSLWAMLAAPLLAGNDLSKMDETTRSILMNKEVIAVDQDSLGKQGDRLSAAGPYEVWTKPLKDGSLAVALFNRSEAVYPITIDLNSMGLSGATHARDLWAHKDLGSLQSSYTAVVPRHGVVMLRISR